MKKLFLYFSAFCLTSLLLVGCSGCGSKKTNVPDPFAEYSEQFTKEDTSAVISLVNQFMEYLKAKDLKSATEMIYYLDKDSIKELDQRKQSRQARALLYVMGCQDYKLDRILFKSDINNEAKLDIILFDKPAGDPRPNKTSFYFRPVKFEGKWYLTTKDNISDTHSELRNEKLNVDNPFEEDSEEKAE